MLQGIIISLILLVCVLLVLVVLAQNSKGGGLTAGMSGASQIMGAKRTTDWIENATWVLAVSLFVLCIGYQFAQPKATAAQQQDKELQDMMLPSTTAPAPAVGGGLTPAAGTESVEPAGDQAAPVEPVEGAEENGEG
jgi:preprotein translocase subunit SecG